jgi:hypothetical protein
MSRKNSRRIPILSFLKKIKLHRKRTSRDISDTLENANFRFLDDGYYKRVYWHNKFPEFVVKVYKRATAYKKDEYVVPPDLEKVYLAPVYKTKKFLVQHKVRVTDLQEALKQIQKRFKKDIYYLYDVHHNNVGWFKNKPVVIDFMTRRHDW